MGIEPLYLKSTEDTPNVILDRKNNFFEISGKSLMDDPMEFYTPVLDWIGAYSSCENPYTNFNFKLEYLNNDSTKLIQDILSSLETIKGVKIYWHFKEHDNNMQELGQEFSELVEIPFEFKTY